MKKKFLEDMYEMVSMKIENVCSFNWRENVNVDKSIYRDYKEYREVMILHALLSFNHFAKEKGHIK